jgi:hypothetical protein
MKNILWASVFILVFFPQLSFGADPSTVGTASVSPALAAFNQKQDDESKAFFQQQAQERADFVKAHPDAMARHDRRFKALMAVRDAQRTGNASSAQKPPDEDDSVSALMAKQLADGQVFFQKLNQEKQAFLSSQGN